MEAFESYIKIAKTLKAFEQAKYEQWLKESLPVIESTLQMHVLKAESTAIKEGTVIIKYFQISALNETTYRLIDYVCIVCLGF